MLDELKTEGKIRHFGASCERLDHAGRALSTPGVEVVQLTLNLLDVEPLEFLQLRATSIDRERGETMLRRRGAGAIGLAPRVEFSGGKGEEAARDRSTTRPIVAGARLPLRRRLSIR